MKYDANVNIILPAQQTKQTAECNATSVRGTDYPVHKPAAFDGRSS